MMLYTLMLSLRDNIGIEYNIPPPPLNELYQYADLRNQSITKVDKCIAIMIKV